MELPTVTYLATQLNARGYDIDKGITDVDVLVKEIARIKGVE